MAPRPRFLESAGQPTVHHLSLRRCDDHESSGVFTFRTGDNRLIFRQCVVHGLAVSGGHGLQSPFLASFNDVKRHLLSESTEGCHPAFAILSDVHEDPVSPTRTLGLNDGTGHFL